VARAREGLSAFLVAARSSWLKCSPARLANWVDLATTIKVSRPVNGDYDHLPEPAFGYCRNHRKAVEKLQRLAAEGRPNHKIAAQARLG